MSELVIDKHGAYLGVKKGMFYVKSSDGQRLEVPPVKLNHISIRSRGIGVSADAILLASKFGVEITVYHKGKPASRILHALKGGGVLTRQAQLEATQNEKALTISKAIVSGKLHNQRLVIHQRAREALAKGRHTAPELEHLADGIMQASQLLAKAETVDQVRAYEAQGALNYWKAVSIILPEELGFKGRETWSPKDPFNKALNIGYGVLRSRTWGAILSANLDPYTGFLHVPRGKHMCLVSDLMEEFRPAAVDRPLISLSLEKPQLLSLIDSEGEREVVTAVSRMLQKDDKWLERAVFEQARRLASYLRGAVPEYTPFKLKW